MGEKSPERLALEARAEALELKFPANIGDDKLTKRIEAAEAERDKDKPPAEGSQGATDDGSQPQTTGADAAPVTKTPPEQKPPEKPPIRESVRITGPKKGRRRAGYRFGPEPVDIPLDDLSEEDSAALIGDPTLTISYP